MMANASRDPYWQAAVRRETLDHPQARAHIQDECAACHMPMARYQAHVQGKETSVFSLLPTSAKQGPSALWAADGVSCTLCHQIQSRNLGKAESFTAGFVIGTQKSLGQRPVFGPFTVDSGRTRVMQSAGRFIPTRGLHMQEAGLCGSCHTLYTHTRGPNGNIIGQLPEQVPYLEWRHSSYSDHQSCQSCHMPTIERPMPISSVLGLNREMFSRHAFRGGNFFVLNMLRRYATPLAVNALPQNLAVACRETEKNLTTSAAHVQIEAARVSNGELTVRLRLSNLTGHKLPTAYPSRRVWIHLTVKDAQGRCIFESGGRAPGGAIAGNDNDQDPTLYEPHYRYIDREDQVQIYESIMVTPEEKVTTGLLSAIGFVKDNRVLPEGFDKETADRDIAVQGRARKDTDFKGGRDRIRYVIGVGNEKPPFRVHARLWYQPISYRWAQNLDQYTAPETEQFVRYYDAMSADSALLITDDMRTVK